MDGIESLIESFKESHELYPIIESHYLLETDAYPYFVPEEIEQLKGYYSDHVDETCVNLYEHNIHALKSAEGKDDETWNSKVSDLDLELKSTEDPDTINRIKQDMISIGWNPEIEYTTENKIKARKRFESIMNERYNRVKIVDMTSLSEQYDIIEESKTGPKFHMIHVVLVKGDSPFSKAIVKFTDGDFSHSALSLDDTFEKLYSFNLINKINKVGGFSTESLKEYPKQNRLCIFTCLVDNKAFKKIKENIDYLNKNIKHTAYSVVNVITLPFNHIKINMTDSMICSQFVASMLKIANIDINKQDPSKVHPNMIYYNMKENSKVYKIFDGLVGDFNSKIIKRFENKIRREKNIAESMILEARKLPIEVKDNGDVLLTNIHPNYTEEYFASHKLLVSYEKTGNIEGIKYEIARLYYMNYMIEKKLYHNHYLPKKSELIKTRARILNDFYAYLKYVCEREKDFNFSKYYEASPFYAHTIEVKYSTLGQIKNVIGYIL